MKLKHIIFILAFLLILLWGFLYFGHYIPGIWVHALLLVALVLVVFQLIRTEARVNDPA